MAAYCITDASVIDPEEFQKYPEQAMPTIEAHGGKILVAGTIAASTRPL